MLDKKIHYSCPYCQKAYWVRPLAGGDQDVIVEHPCSVETCEGPDIKLRLEGVAELSLMKDDE